MSVDAPQLGSFASSMHDAADQLRKLDEPAESSAQLVAQDAAQTAPRGKTRKLAASHVVIAQHGGATVANTQPYAMFPHYGTRYVAAHPWLATALDRDTARIEDAYAARVGLIVERV